MVLVRCIAITPHQKSGRKLAPSQNDRCPLPTTLRNEKAAELGEALGEVPGRIDWLRDSSISLPMDQPRCAV
jgi:hypothetical protein